MSDPLHVPADEYGRVRIFTTELPPEGASAITPNNVARLLGVDIDPKKAEIVPSGVFNELGLTTYLTEGYGVSESDIAGRKAALDALSGLVIVLPTSAFGGKDVTLDPDPALRFVGVFDEEPHKAHDMSQRAAPSTTISTPAASEAPAPTTRRGSSMIALGALIIAAALLVFYFL